MTMLWRLSQGVRCVNVVVGGGDVQWDGNVLVVDVQWHGNVLVVAGNVAFERGGGRVEM